MFGETTIFHVKIWNHPIETPIYKQMFQVPGTSYDNKMTWEYNKTKRDQSFPTSFCYPLATNNPPRIQSALLGQLPTPREPKLAEANLGHPRVREDGHLPPVVSTTSGIPWYFLTEVFFWKKKPGWHEGGRRFFMVYWLVAFLKYFWNFQPDPWGFMIQFDKHILQMGWFNHQLVEESSRMKLQSW